MNRSFHLLEEKEVTVIHYGRQKNFSPQKAHIKLLVKNLRYKFKFEYFYNSAVKPSALDNSKYCLFYSLATGMVRIASFNNL